MCQSPFPKKPQTHVCSFFPFQSGLCSSSELETSRGGHIRIQHLTAAASQSTSTGNCSTIGLGGLRGHGHTSIAQASNMTAGSAHIASATSVAASEMNQSRFPRLQSCAHFHYEFTDIGPITVKNLLISTLNKILKIHDCEPGFDNDPS